MSITSIWLDSILKYLFIESKNVLIGVRTINIWSSKVGLQQGPHYCVDGRNSMDAIVCPRVAGTF